MASRYGLPGIPVAAETIALMQCIELIEKTGCRVHFQGLSSARSVDLIAKAKQLQLPVSADVAMHQLHLTEQDMLPYDSHYHVLPPLRSEQDKDALIAAVRNNTINSICSMPRILAGSEDNLAIPCANSNFPCLTRRNIKGSTVSREDIPGSVSGNAPSFASMSCGWWSLQILFIVLFRTAAINASLSCSLRKGGNT
jgi:hypothetical protein